MFNRLTAYMLLCMLLYTCIWQLITLCIIFCEWRGSINVSSNCSNWKFAFYNIFIIFVPICGIRVEAKNNRAFSDLNVILPYFIGRNQFLFITANNSQIIIIDLSHLKRDINCNTPSTKFWQLASTTCIVNSCLFIATLIHSFLTYKWASLYRPNLVPNDSRPTVPSYIDRTETSTLTW